MIETGGPSDDIEASASNVRRARAVTVDVISDAIDAAAACANAC